MATLLLWAFLTNGVGDNPQIRQTEYRDKEGNLLMIGNESSGPIQRRIHPGWLRERFQWINPPERVHGGVGPGG